MLEERVVNLEIKFSHQDELLNELNKIVAKQQLTIESLEKKIRLLSDELGSNDEKGTAELEVPNHL